ncbi:MAG TPA: amidohydrolase family protein [Candidatus Dormibacteraeota bacterium]|nr:amidohydrolase family protein [Candidatus Dormibacteraeota bacterium]
MRRLQGKFATSMVFSGIGIAALLAAGFVFAAQPPSSAGKPPAAAMPPVPALTPYVEAHTHYNEKDPQGSVRAALAGLKRQNAAMIFMLAPPDTYTHPGHYDAEVILPEAKKYPGKLAVLGGGGTLNAMIMQSVATGDAGPAVRKKFSARAEQLLREGVIGFGEMAAEHFDGGTPYQYAPPDHPLYLLLADIAAQHGVPIVLHMEAVPQDMALPAGLKSPPNPPRLHANIAAFERLLDHNPRAKIIWAHAGSDNTGFRTPALCARLLAAHPNLYMEIKTDPLAKGMNYPMENGKIKPEWLALFTKFPDRFIIGTDQHYPEPNAPEQRWQTAVDLFNQLPAGLRKKIGTENVAHIYGKSVAAYLLHAAKN